MRAKARARRTGRGGSSECLMAHTESVVAMATQLPNTVLLRRKSISHPSVSLDARVSGSYHCVMSRTAKLCQRSSQTMRLGGQAE